MDLCSSSLSVLLARHSTIITKYIKDSKVSYEKINIFKSIESIASIRTIVPHICLEDNPGSLNLEK